MDVPLQEFQKSFEYVHLDVIFFLSFTRTTTKFHNCPHTTLEPGKLCVPSLFWDYVRDCTII